MLIQGHWYAAGSAAQVKAWLRAIDQQIIIECETGVVFSYAIDELTASDRLGNVARKLTLPDGSVFSTRDNDSVDSLLKPNRLLYLLESKLRWSLIALVVIIGASFGFIRWGVPWVSIQVAHLVPDEINQLITAEALGVLDEYVFEESQLSPARMDQLRTHFNDNLLSLVDESADIKFKLHFRQWGAGEDGVPNALALPAGDIILTDKLVEISQNQNEIDAVLWHEIGHVVHLHGLQRVVQGALITTIVMMVTGDASMIVDIGTGIGALLLSSQYARDHESEADLYAFEHMIKAKNDPIAFSNIMAAMTGYMQESDEHDKDEDADIFDYLASHPVTAKRIALANRYSVCFRQGLVTCE